MKSSVGRRLSTAFALLAVGGAALGGLGAWSGHQQALEQDRLERLEDVSRQVQELRYLDADISGWQAYVFSQAAVEGPAAALDPEAVNLSGLRASEAAGDELLAAVDEDALTAAELAVLERVRGQWATYFAGTQDMLDQIGDGTPEGLAAAYTTLNGPLDTSWSALLDSTEELAASIDGRGTEARAASDARDRELLRDLVVLTAVVVLAGAALARTTTRSITTPLGQVSRVVAALSAGRLDERAAVGREDELGALAAATNTAVERLAAVLDGVSASALALASSSAGLHDLAGDLTATAESSSERAAGVASASGRISTDIEAVAQAGEQMTAAIGEIAASASAASAVAASAVTATATAAVTIDRLAASSREIGSVVQLITGIAEQTNLLALNATIEAARAGELGKGFAVVAGEVKELARQTARATQDITDRVGATQQDSAAAGAVVEQIGSVIAEVDALQATIAAAVEEQSATTAGLVATVTDVSAGSRRITGSISEVADAASRTRTSAAATAEASTDVARVVADLERLVAGFRR